MDYLKRIPNVVDVWPYYSYTANVNVGGTSIRSTMVGIDLTALPILYKGLTIAEGHIPLIGDTTSAIIGYSIANPTSGTPLTVNQMVSMSISGITGTKGAVSYAVLATGILQQYGTALFANIDDTIYVSFQAAQFLSKTPYYSGIYVVVDSTDNVAAVQTTMTTNYGTNVRIVSPGQVLSSIQGITSSLTLFLGSIGAVSLFVATVGIINTMYVSVMERTREIGILKALGYRPKQIMGMFLAEAALTGLIGAFTGLGLGYALSFLMGGMLGGSVAGPGMQRGATIVPVFSGDLIIFALVFPVVLATVAGLYPAWRGSRMNPVVALKYE